MGTSIVVDILARDNASRTFARVGDSAQRSTRGLLGASRAMEVTRAASMALATGLGVAAFGIMKVGSDYVDSLNKIQALTGAGNATMKRAAETLEGNASVYAKMGQTTGDAAKGVVELTKAGLSLDKSLKSATATMILAKAGEMETGEAATFVSNTLNTFSLKAKDAGRVVDILANAANKSSADVSDLAETMKYVGPIAAQSGVSVQELGGLMAELANNGIKGSQAGTTLRQMLLRLQAPSATAQKTFDALGLSVTDAKGNMKPMADVIAILNKQMDGLTATQRAAAMKNIFGINAMSGATAIIEGGSQKLRNYTKAMGEAGSGARMANANSKGLMGTLKMIKAYVISAAQALYRQLSPAIDGALRPAVQWVIDHKDAFSAWASSVKSALAPAFEKVGEYAGKLREKLEPVTSWMKRNPDTMKAVATALGVVATAAVGLGVALGVVSLAASPVTLAIVAIAGLTAGIVIAYKKSEEFRTTVQALGRALKIEMSAMLAIWKAVWPTMLAIFKRVFAALKPILSGVMMQIRGTIQFFTAIIQGDWSGAWQAMKTVLAGIWKQIKAVLSLAWDSIKKIFSGAGTMLSDVGEAIIDGLVAGIKAAAHKVTDIVGSIAGGIKSGFKGALSIFSPSRVFRGYGVNIMQGLANGLDAGHSLLSTALKRVTDAVSNAGDKLKSLIQSRNSFAASFQQVAGSAFGATAADGSTLNFGDVLTYAQTRAANASAYNRNLQAVIGKGLSKSLIKQLASQGESGAAQLAAIAGASSSQIAMLNALNKQTEQQYAAAGNRAGSSVYGDQIASQREDVKALRDLRNEMRKFNESIGNGLHGELVVKGDGTIVALIKHDQRKRGVPEKDRVK